MQSIAQPIAVKKNVFGCHTANSYAKLEIWKFKLRNKNKATK